MHRPGGGGGGEGVSRLGVGTIRGMLHISLAGKGDTRGVDCVRACDKPPELRKPLHKPIHQSESSPEPQIPNMHSTTFRSSQTSAPPEPYISSAPFMGRRHSAGGYSNAPISPLDGEPPSICATLSISGNSTYFRLGLS